MNLKNQTLLDFAMKMRNHLSMKSSDILREPHRLKKSPTLFWRNFKCPVMQLNEILTLISLNGLSIGVYRFVKYSPMKEWGDDYLFYDLTYDQKSYSAKKRGKKVRKVIIHHLRNVNVVCRLLHDQIPSSCHLQIHTKYAVTMGPTLKYIQGIVCHSLNPVISKLSNKCSIFM